MKLVITCEHGGNTVPVEFKHLFKDTTILDTHRGYDLGALDVFNYLKPLADYSNYCTTSRLLIELNRSLNHKNLFSEFTKPLSTNKKNIIIQEHYKGYREAVTQYIFNTINKNEPVLHLSIHTFTPTLNLVKRHCDIGLLYDSRIKKEKQFAVDFKKQLSSINPNYLVRFNYPYLGKSDGFTTALRQRFTKNYIGIEIEINQAYSKNNKMPEAIKILLKKSILKLKA